MINLVLIFLLVFLINLTSYFAIIVYSYNTIRKKLIGKTDEEILLYIKEKYEIPTTHEFYCDDKVWADAVEDFNKKKCSVQCEWCARQMG